MNKGPLSRLPKKRSLGVHIKMQNERHLRKMLSVSINQDGGVMVIPHLELWHEIVCSRLVVPFFGGLLPDEDSYVRSGADNKPKLHYHRSGMSSVQPGRFQKGEGRITVHLPGMTELDAVQIFSIAARVPGRLPWDRGPRSGGVAIIMDRHDVHSLLVSGVLYDRSRISEASLGGLKMNEPVNLASGHNNAVFIDLSGYELDVVLGLYFRPDSHMLPDFAADFSLTSFHQDRISAEGAVAIHAGPGIPFAALMHPVPSVEAIHQVDSIDLIESNIRIDPSGPRRTAR